MIMPNRKSKRKDGFTLVVLMVAFLISATGLAAGYELFTVLQTVSDRQDESISVSWEMTNALEQIREDLIHATDKKHGQGPLFAGGNKKLLKFYSLCLIEHQNGITGIRQISKIEYELVKENDLLYLYRSMTPISNRPDQSTSKGKKLLSMNIEDAKIFFYRDNKLEPSFSSSQNLPLYVKLEITVKGQTWPLGVWLPCSTTDSEQVL